MGRIVHITWDLDDGAWLLIRVQYMAVITIVLFFSFYVFHFLCVSLQMILSTKVCFICGEMRKRNHIPGRFHSWMLTLQAPTRKVGRNISSGLCFGKCQPLYLLSPHETLWNKQGLKLGLWPLTAVFFKNMFWGHLPQNHSPEVFVKNQIPGPHV